MVTAHYDDLTIEDLTGVLGMKWNKFPDCIGAFVAEMDFRTAPPVIEKLQEIVQAGFFGYLPESKAEELSVAVSRWYADTTGWQVPAERIFALPDVLKGLEVTITHYAPKGGKVIVPTPAYMPFLFVPTISTSRSWKCRCSTTTAPTPTISTPSTAPSRRGELLILCNRTTRSGAAGARGNAGDQRDRRAPRRPRLSDEIHAPLVYGDKRHIPYASFRAAATTP